MQLEPNRAEAHYNLGVIWSEQGKLNEASACYQRALQLRPNYAEAYHNLGNVCRELGQPDNAIACYRRALQLKPDNADAHFALGVALLLAGDFDQGWPEYEWRWQTKQMARGKRFFSQPLWDGSSLSGKTILLYAEQGLGDTIQFIRYAGIVKSRGGKVIVECHAVLVPLFQSCASVDRALAPGSCLPPFDVQAPLMSLPLILRTTLSTIPSNVPYLAADAALVDHCRQELEWGVGSGEWGAGSGTKRIATASALRTPSPPPLDSGHSPLPTPHSPLFRIGIVWHCKNIFPSDYQRSAPLAAFAPIAALPGVHLFSLQKEPSPAPAVSVSFPFTDLGGCLQDFADTAAALKNLDLLITIDTAIAHCAGALGVPVWVALPFAPDWRWLLEREDSPWYPTMRLFRQKRWGDWDEVFQRITEEVKAVLSDK